MTAREWVAAREHGVPSALRARLDRALAKAEQGAGTDHEPPVVLLDAALATLQGVLDAPAMTRAHALDVLAADALATYAFEAAAEAGSVVEHADAAMVRVGALGSERP